MCDVKQLKAFLEDRLQQPFSTFRWIDETAGTDNFYCRTQAGEKLVIKCVSPNNKNKFTGLRNYAIPHMRELKDFPAAIHLAYEPWYWGENLVVAMTWCSGRPARPDSLTAQQQTNFIQTYASFSREIQKTQAVLPAFDFVGLRTKVLAQLKELACSELIAFIEDEIPLSAVTYDAKRVRVIHGDFHRKNFFFEKGQVRAFLDYEAFCQGYPTEDWLRYLVASAEHFHPLNVWRYPRRMAFFDRILPFYSLDEWRLAIDGLLLQRIHQCICDNQAAPARIVRYFRQRFRFYLKLHQRIVASQKELCP